MPVNKHTHAPTLQIFMELIGMNFRGVLQTSITTCQPPSAYQIKARAQGPARQPGLSARNASVNKYKQDYTRA
jgi:hypothetical protein